MTYMDIWEKIREFALWFYNFAMTEGENKFLLVNEDFLEYMDQGSRAQVMFCAPFVIVALITIFASDSFHPFDPDEGIKMWFRKISVFKVTVFAASVFSLHTFYKMLVTIAGNLTGAQASVLAMDCLGTYINPFSVCALAIAVSTLNMEHGRRQAFCLGLSLFFTPALLTFQTLTLEHVVIFAVGLAFGIAAGVLYRTGSMDRCYLWMSALYLIAKFFLIYYSGETLLLSGETPVEKGMQFLACMELDLVLILILTLVQIGYKEITVEKGKRTIRRDISWASVIALVLIGSVLSGHLSTVYAGVPEESPVLYSFWDEEEEEEEENVSYRYEKLAIDDAEASSCLVSSKGKEYDIGLTYDNDCETCWQDGEDGTGEGETLTYDLDDEYSVGMLRIANGNKKSKKKYKQNCRLAQVSVYYYRDGEYVGEQTLGFDDDYTQEYADFYLDPVSCDRIVIEVEEVYEGTKYEDLCVSEVEIYQAIRE